MLLVNRCQKMRNSSFLGNPFLGQLPSLYHQRIPGGWSVWSYVTHSFEILGQNLSLSASYRISCRSNWLLPLFTTISYLDRQLRPLLRHLSEPPSAKSPARLLEQGSAPF